MTFEGSGGRFSRDCGKVRSPRSIVLRMGNVFEVARRRWWEKICEVGTLLMLRCSDGLLLVCFPATGGSSGGLSRLRFVDGVEESPLAVSVCQSPPVLVGRKAATWQLDGASHLRPALSRSFSSDGELLWRGSPAGLRRGYSTLHADGLGDSWRS